MSNFPARLVVGICFFLSFCSGYGEYKAKRGILSLKEWDFEQQGIVQLNGEWEFYWNKLLSPEEIKKGGVVPDYYIIQPADWADVKESFVLFKEKGYGTYRLRVLIPSRVVTHHMQLGLRVEECHTAFKAWVNGIPVAMLGKVSSDSSSYIPAMHPVYEGFVPLSDTLDIVIQAANFIDNNQGGLDEPVSLGLFAHLKKASNRRIMLFMFTLGILFFMIVHHCFLYILRPADSYNLFFMLVCVAMAVMTLWEGEKIIYLIFPSFPLTWFLKIWYATPLTIGLMIWYHYHFYPREFYPWALWFFTGFYLLNALLIVLLPVESYTRLINYSLFVAFISLVYLWFVSFRCLLKKLRFSELVFTGMFIPVLVGINDVLYGMDIIHTGYYGPVGFLIYVFSQSAIISYRFSESYSRAEKLSGELARVNVELENKVKERTKEYMELNENLQKLLSSKETFLSILSHHVRTTFQSLRTLSDLLGKALKNEEKEKASKIAGWIGQSIEETDQVLANTITWQNIQLGKIVCRPSSVDVQVLVMDVLEEEKERISAKQLEVSCKMEKNLCVWVDRNLFSLAFRHILSNAIKFTPRQGRIEIKTYKTGHAGVIQIKDSGVGMEDEKIKLLFRSETAFSTFGTENERGTGMGLLIAHESVTKNKGFIFVSSQVGKGSVFSIHLPLKKDLALS